MLETPAVLPLSVSTSVAALLSLQDPDAVEAALESAELPVIIEAVCVVPALERKTALLWALEDRRRREVLDHLPPALIAALIQNLEEDNHYLLGDLSLEQFHALLSLCSDERKYYWLVTALSFTDARANALPLLIPTSELVNILMTRGEFEEHLREVSEYRIEDARLPPEAMSDPAQAILDLFGPEQFLRQFPIRDARLERVLQNLLDFDSDRYVDILRGGLRLLSYHENHPLEWDTLSEDPVLLKSLGRVETADEDRQSPAELSLPDEVDAPLDDGPPLALVPVATSPLVRISRALAPEQQQRVAQELQYLFIRQAIAEGGSFLRSDLERISKSVEAYLLLGLHVESGGSGESEVLGSRPLRKISQNGARVVEALRQVAFRLQPLEKVLASAQKMLLRSLVRPHLTVGESGEPELLLRPDESLPERAAVPMVAAMLQEVSAWADLARALGLQATEAALSGGQTVEALQEEVALAAVLYSQVELGLVVAGDVRRFRARYVNPENGEILPRARLALQRALRGTAGTSGEGAAYGLLALALERLAAREFQEV